MKTLFKAILGIAVFGMFINIAMADQDIDWDINHPTEYFHPYTVIQPYTFATTYPQKITVTTGGVTFDSNYDNGSLLNISSTGVNTFSGTLATDSGESGTAKYWFRFRMTGIAGRTITINLDHSQTPSPVISYDSVTWRRMTTSEATTSSKMILTFGAGTDFAELAFFYPLSYSETNSQVSTIVQGSPYATITTIGQSYQGRDMLMVTLTDTAVPNTNKHGVWMHTRAHAGEHTGTWCMLGFLKQILEDSTTGQVLRQNCVFHVVPLENCDGVFLGNTRWDSQGIDEEAQWGNPTRIPETANIKAQVDAIMAGPNPNQVSLNLHSTVNNFSDTFFVQHVPPSVTTTYETIEQNYMDAVTTATLLFQDKYLDQTQLDPTVFIESYYWNNWGASVMAMTHEGHYYYRVTDGQLITSDDYQEIGKGMARACIYYFNLSGVVPVKDWTLY